MEEVEEGDEEDGEEDAHYHTYGDVLILEVIPATEVRRGDG